MFRRFVIVGPGLIGGSVGMAVRAAGLAQRVIGVGHQQSSIDAAVASGAIDEGTLNVEDAAQDADFLLLCTRIRLFTETAHRAIPRLARHAIISDVGSTKRAVTAAIEKAVGSVPVSFVGSHPMAGSEQRGIAAARADLFRGSTCVVTASAKSSPEAEARVAEMWRALGATVVRMSASEHDAIMAEVSHLPHVAAAAIVAAASDGALAHAARGFRDATRIASGDPSVWRDICATNRDNILNSLDNLISKLENVRAAMASGDDDAVERFLAEAKKRRDEGLTAKG
jgi:prephenate dehydrogenase